MRYHRWPIGLATGLRRFLAPLRAFMPILALLISTTASGAGLTSEAKKQIVQEWGRKEGFARRDLNNVQITPNFRMSMRTDSEDLIRAGSKVSVSKVEIEEDLRYINLHVKQVGSGRWTEVRLILDKPFGAMLTDEQKTQLDAMWARLVSLEPTNASPAEDAAEGKPEPGNSAILHVYRKHATGFGGSVPFAFNVDGLDVAGLADSRYVTVDVEAGPHHCYFAKRENNTDITLAAGREYYMEISISRFAGIKLRLVDPKDGLAVIQKYKYEDANNIWDRSNVRPAGK